MRAITKTEAQEWCRSHDIAIDDRGLPQPDFAETQGLDFKIPEDTGQRIALLHKLFRSVPPEREILVWFDDWGVWPSGERKHMFERFRDSYGEHRWLSDAPLICSRLRNVKTLFHLLPSPFSSFGTAMFLLMRLTPGCFSPTMRLAGFVRVRRCLCLSRPRLNHGFGRTADYPQLRGVAHSVLVDGDDASAPSGRQGESASNPAGIGRYRGHWNTRSVSARIGQDVPSGRRGRVWSS